MKTLYLASAMLVDEDNRLLTVRKKGSTFYMMPGGKIEAGETAIAALCRELQEELGLQLNLDEVEFLGIHETQAVNELSTMVQGNVFLVVIPSSAVIEAQAEIEEICWLSKENYQRYNLAHLLSEFTLPRWLARGE